MDRNSSILCYSFTASFYPLELSLLIILICFCFNCFSGSLFTPGWNLQIPRCHPPRLCPQKAADWTRPSPHWVQVISTTSLPIVPSRCHPAGTTKPTSLLCPCPGLGFPIWSQGFGFSFEIFFSSHFLNIPTRFPFRPFLGYQSLSRASNFQAKTTNLMNWNYGSAAEKAQAVKSDRETWFQIFVQIMWLQITCDITCKSCDVGMLPDLPGLLFPVVKWWK